MKHNLLILILFTLVRFSALGQDNTSDTHYCGTGLISISPQEQKLEDDYQKYKKSRKGFSSRGSQFSGKILYVPFKFKGETDPTITDMEKVKTFFSENSFGTYTLSWDITPVIELDLTKQEYLDDTSLFWPNDLKQAWESLGYDRNQYNYLFMRSHVGQPFLTGALGTAGGTTIKSVSASVGVACHEIGHSLYFATGVKSGFLHHANFWIANNGQVIGPGTSQEYGNKFAIMGGTSLQDFGLPHKLNMDWIREDEYSYVADNGTYRIYAHDRGSKQPGRKYGIKVGKIAHPTTQIGKLYYFIEYKSKRQGTEDGVLILTENQTGHTNLLDNHPGVSAITGNNEGWKDAPLAVGETLRDDADGITMENIASGGMGDDAWMDVKITFDDPGSTDHLPEITFVTPTDGQTFDAGTDIPVEITASDPDGPISSVRLWTGNIFFPFTDATAPYTFTLNFPTPGDYQLKAAADTSPVGELETITIHIVAPGGTALTADAGTDKILTCVTTQVTIGGSNTTNGATYVWSTSNGNIISGGTTKNATVDKAGTYTLTVSKSGSTTVTDDVVVTEDKTPPTANAGADQTINSGESTQLNATGGVTYAWLPTTGLSNANIANPTASPTSDITYTVTVTASNGCTATDQVEITINTSSPTLTADAGTDKTLTCVTTQVTIGGSNTTNGAAYVWSTSNGNIVSGGTTKNATVDKVGTYTLTVSKSGSTTVTDDVAVTEDKTPPTANAGADQTINSGESTQLNATGGMTYAWSPTTGLSNANIANPMANPMTTTTYTVTVTGSNGCTDTDQIRVIVNGTVDPCDTLPIANAGVDVTIEEGSSTQLNGSGGDTYSWSPITGLSDESIANPDASPTATITYTLTVTDGNGCTATDEVMITVVESKFKISNNSFSPNGDNLNDVWHIEGLKDNTTCEMSIYNRWGNKVFTSDIGYNNPWDGMYNGKRLPIGTYFYILKLGDNKVIKGHVNILK